MKVEKLLNGIIAAVVAFLLSLAAIACIVTGLEMVVDLWTVALWCGIGAVVSAICCSLPMQIVPLCATVLTGNILWFGGGMKLSFQAVIYRFSRKYNAAFGWGVVRPLHYTADMLEPELWLFLCFLGAVLAMLIAWALCRRKFVLLAALPAAICVGSCFLVRETVPATLWIYLFLFGFLLLLLTQSVRKEDMTRGNRLTLIAAIPLALFLLTIFALTPQDSYKADKPAKAVMNAVLYNPTFRAIFGDLTKEGNTGSSVDSGIVRLEDVGVRSQSSAEILLVKTNYYGSLYLRGRALDAYDGKTWTDSGVSTSKLYWPSADQLEPVGEVWIKTRFAHKMFYLPYYVQSMNLTDMTRGMENTTKLTEYSITTARLPDDRLLSAVKETPLGDTSAYQHLSDSVLKWAEPLAQQITAGKRTTYEKVQAIGDYVRSSAKYDLRTDTMPYREKDFAKWFLEDSETGYCVHFATAATVLLQAAGIPARYVTGYMIQVQADCVTTACESDAHAWVEYWQPGFGWAILEVTPPVETEKEEGTAPAPQTAKKPVDGDVVALVGAAALLVAFAALFIQRWVRLYLRRKKLHSGSLGQQTLAYWQEAVRFANCLKESPSEDLLEIAERVKFSNHPPREEDLECFRVYLDSAKQRIRSHSLLKKLYYRFVLALC